MAIADRIRTLFARTKDAPRLSDSVVTHDLLDEGVLTEMREEAERFEALFESPPEINMGSDENPDPKPYQNAPDLYSDTFYSMHTWDEPDIKPGEEVKPDHELHRQIMQQAIASEGWKELRPYTRHDDIGAAIGTMRFVDSINESLETVLAEHAKRAEEMRELQEQMAADEEALAKHREDVRGQGGKPSPWQREEIKKLAQSKSNARSNLQQHAQQQAQSPLTIDVAEAVSDAVDDAKGDAEAVSNLPGAAAGGGGRMPPEHAIEIAQKWRSDHVLREIAKLIGRFERDMRYKRTQRVVGGREEPIDVMLGNDLGLTLPTELMKLMHPSLRLDFMRRFYEKQVLQYETVGTAEAGRGPVVFCIDGSGSMGGQPNVWARACALAVISIAHREKRHAAAVEFGSSHDALVTWEFPAKRPIDIETVTDMASHFHGGGTDITTGLLGAKAIIDTHPDFKRADIVLVTDGHDHLQDDDLELRAELQNRGVRIHGITIGMAPTPYILEMTEDNVGVYDLANPSEATDMLAQSIT